MTLIIETERLPAVLVRAIEFNLGVSHAKLWLDEASALANRQAVAWNISFDQVLTGGALSLCIAGMNEVGARVVMKIPADIESGRREVAALMAWNGVGCPRVLAVEEDTSVFLMEYLPETQGTMDAGAVFSLAKALHRCDPLTKDFPSLAANVNMRIEWAADRFAKKDYVHLRSDLQIAREICQRLLDTAVEEVLLHGDFQRKNLIVTPQGLRTLDPHACMGDPIFDAAFWVALVHHDEALDKQLSRYPADPESSEFRRFFCWTWAISVIEYRPYQELGASERQDFISKHRATAIEEMQYL